MSSSNTQFINNKAKIDNVINKCIDYENYIKNQLEYVLTTTDDVNDNSGYKNMMFRKYIKTARNLHSIKLVSYGFNSTNNIDNNSKNSNNSNNSNNELNELHMKISAAEQMVGLIDLFKPIFDNPNTHMDSEEQPYNRIGIYSNMFVGSYVLPSTYDDDIKIKITDNKIIGRWVNQSILCNFNNYNMQKLIEAFINAPEEYNYKSEDNCMEITVNKQRQNFYNGYVIFQRNLIIQNRQLVVFNDVWTFYFNKC